MVDVTLNASLGLHAVAAGTGTVPVQSALAAQPPPSGVLPSSVSQVILFHPSGMNLERTIFGSAAFASSGPPSSDSGGGGSISGLPPSGTPPSDTPPSGPPPGGGSGDDGSGHDDDFVRANRLIAEARSIPVNYDNIDRIVKLSDEAADLFGAEHIGERLGALDFALESLRMLTDGAHAELCHNPFEGGRKTIMLLEVLGQASARIRLKMRSGVAKKGESDATLVLEANGMMRQARSITPSFESMPEIERLCCLAAERYPLSAKSQSAASYMFAAERWKEVSIDLAHRGFEAQRQSEGESIVRQLFGEAAEASSNSARLSEEAHDVYSHCGMRTEAELAWNMHRKSQRVSQAYSSIATGENIGERIAEYNRGKKANKDHRNASQAYMYGNIAKKRAESLEASGDFLSAIPYLDEAIAKCFEARRLTPYDNRAAEYLEYAARAMRRKAVALLYLAISTKFDDARNILFDGASDMLACAKLAFEAARDEYDICGWSGTSDNIESTIKAISDLQDLLERTREGEVDESKYRLVIERLKKGNDSAIRLLDMHSRALLIMAAYRVLRNLVGLALLLGKNIQKIPDKNIPVLLGLARDDTDSRNALDLYLEKLDEDGVIADSRISEYFEEHLEREVDQAAAGANASAASGRAAATSAMKLKSEGSMGDSLPYYDSAIRFYYDATSSHPDAMMQGLFLGRTGLLLMHKAEALKTILATVDGGMTLLLDDMKMLSDFSAQIQRLYDGARCLFEMALARYESTGRGALHYFTRREKTRRYLMDSIRALEDMAANRAMARAYETVPADSIEYALGRLGWAASLRLIAQRVESEGILKLAPQALRDTWNFWLCTGGGEMQLSGLWFLTGFGKYRRQVRVSDIAHLIAPSDESLFAGARLIDRIEEWKRSPKARAATVGEEELRMALIGNEPYLLLVQPQRNALVRDLLAFVNSGQFDTAPYIVDGRFTAEGADAAIRAMLELRSPSP